MCSVEALQDCCPGGVVEAWPKAVWAWCAVRVHGTHRGAHLVVGEGGNERVRLDAGAATVDGGEVEVPCRRGRLSMELDVVGDEGGSFGDVRHVPRTGDFNCLDLVAAQRL